MSAPTNGTILGVFASWGTGEASLIIKNAFAPSESTNWTGEDIIQVVNRSGKVVWNLNAEGVAATNPASPSENALLAKLQGASVQSIQPGKLDIIQFVQIYRWIPSGFAAGQQALMHVDYTGTVYLP